MQQEINNIFIKKNYKNTVFDLKCIILNRYAFESRNIEMKNSEVSKKFLTTKNILDLEYTDHNKYVVESPIISIRKLLPMRVERKCVKASKHVRNIFF